MNSRSRSTSVATTPHLDPKTVHKKLRMASELFRFAFETKRFQLRKKHPELDDREINHRAYALIERGCLR